MNYYEQIKKFKSIERRLLKIDKEIHDMGFNVVEHAGSFCIIEGEPWDSNGKRRYNIERYQITMPHDWGTVDF